MKDLLKKGLALALGMAVASREQIEKVVDELVKKGEVSAAESKNLVDELIKKGEEEHQAMRTKMRENVNEHVKERLRELEVPSQETVKNLESRVEELIRRLEKLENRE
ncbi:poly(hydroxyalcanoate) granule associated protein (phasin) [Peptococcaceae bacterium CEB3]|nr:poly(hydroxyalcanoate) granule associated protein (phasin) [Peptococcaceae bacterium CEB3]